jgi:hypothetical protein
VAETPLIVTVVDAEEEVFAEPAITIYLSDDAVPKEVEEYVYDVELASLLTLAVLVMLNGDVFLTALRK